METYAFSLYLKSSIAICNLISYIISKFGKTIKIITHSIKFKNPFFLHGVVNNILIFCKNVSNKNMSLKYQKIETFSWDLCLLKSS